MRGSSNRTAEAIQLLAEIEAWSARTGTRENAIGHVLFLHPGFVGLLRLRLTVSVEKELAVRRFIYHDHPDGFRGELPITHGNGTRPRSAGPSLSRGQVRGAATANLTDSEIAGRRLDRDPCPRCGVRGDVGCNHSRQPLGTVL